MPIALERVKPKVNEERVKFLKSIEEKWQRRWRESKIFEPEPIDNKKKFFITFPYPYINAYPHLGSAYTILRNDITARYKRMKGFNVLFPQAWHATGSPIVAAALRVKEGDQRQIGILKSMGIPENEIPKFATPEYWVYFFHKEWRKDFERFGLSIDWRREFFTTYLNPPYNKFIQWQYNKLRKKGFIVKGTHPVVWCPKEEKVVGDHDRPDEYAGISPEEVAVIKFKGEDGLIYPCLTYRPETVYGAVNVWVNPDYEYIIASIDGEKWVIGEYGVSEFRSQGHSVEIVGKIHGRELLGKLVFNPVTGWRVPVLPALFVEPEQGTGVVMSVPAHAPYDYAALEDLKHGLAEKYGLDRTVVESLKPIPIIKLKEYGEIPAETVVKRLKVENQLDRDKLDEATREIYSREFYHGVLSEAFGRWAGVTVAEGKERVLDELIKVGVALRHYTLPRTVYCRCGARTHVKIVEDQWFLRYSDREWKQLAHECIDSMEFLPESLREYFHRQVDWYKDWACTHKGELGTPLPWDPYWVLESLSDSTVYMAYYVLAKYLQHPNEYGIDWEKLDDSFFDYVLLGEGDARSVAEKIGVSAQLIEQMRREFLYWYPVDMRISGKDLMPNHLVFFIFHHVAIFPPQFWPRGIGINGLVLVAGEKMAKSKGNFILLREALDWWGADATRLAEAYAGNSGLDDANFEPEFADKAVDLLVEWYEFAVNNYGRGRLEWLPIDDWFESVLNRTIMEVEECMERGDFKDALVKGFFNLQNSFKWYLRRCGEPNKEVLGKFIEYQTLILAPFVPHICEEIWEKLGKQEMISLSQWPVVDKERIKLEAELAEDIVKKVLEDVTEILNLIKGRPKTIKIIVASDWKYGFASAVADEVRKGVPVKEALRVAANRLDPSYRKQAGKVIEAYARSPGLLQLLLPREIEYRALTTSVDFFRRQTGVDVEVLREEEARSGSKVPLPGRPAILVSTE
ncbi:MAG: leucine--tRNA ligase [Thermofilaceae archaeon]|nr:leucine--tRNA ligase [Thermofilaceae archaeon]MCX8180293.1 leucine--tRNA ligase [Thermofilaceae archaeon]MDW8003828.1 leucine--tRNA ligase [Thermofilaceae archaeon]